MSIIRNGLLSADLDVPVVLPTLNLDFANSQELDPRITFTRGSIGTRVNRNGLIETVAANQPRFDFDPISGECKGLLIEESRTNSLLRSEDFSLWTASNASVQSNVITAPDGNTTADKLVENSSTGNKEVNLGSITFTSGTSLTFSCFVKAGERNLFRLAATTGFFASATNAFFNLSNGTVSLIQGGITSASIIPYPNGWYRCVATMLPTSSGSGNVFITLVRSGTTSTYGGDGTSGIYIWGAQLEAGTFPTSYIPTTASTVTRSADNVEMTGTNFSSWYNQTEGTFFYNGTLPFITNDTVTRVPFGVSNGFNFSNSIYVAKTPTTLGLSFTVINNNVVQTTGSSLPNMTSSKFKIAVAVADKNIYSSGYGGAINKFSKSSATIPPATRLSLGKEPWNGSPLNPIIGCINKFAYYPKALSPAELQYLTQ
jgi:hypothetical protein